MTRVPDDAQRRKLVRYGAAAHRVDADEIRRRSLNPDAVRRSARNADVEVPAVGRIVVTVYTRAAVPKPQARVLRAAVRAVVVQSDRLYSVGKARVLDEQGTLVLRDRHDAAAVDGRALDADTICRRSENAGIKRARGR